MAERMFDQMHLNHTLEWIRSGSGSRRGVTGVDAAQGLSARRMRRVRVIRGVADVARATVRESDVITRWGGEEYLVLLNNCSLAQALDVAENLRAAVERHDFGLPAPQLPAAGRNRRGRPGPRLDPGPRVFRP